MPNLILLGSGAALSGPARENSYLVVQGKSSLLIDCAGSPVQRLQRAGVSLDSLDQIVLTHYHADHIYGLPILMMDLWLAGRRKELILHGLPATLETAKGMLSALHAETWPNLYPIRYRPVEPEQSELLVTMPEWTVSVLPAQHYVPSLSVRVTARASGRTATYSCDTAPTDNLVEFARGSDYLFHEATFLDQSSDGHSSAVQAGAQAQRAGVKKLVLVHLPPEVEARAWRAAARRNFRGPIHVARDLDRFEL